MSDIEPTYYADYRTARDGARDADQWRYPQPGQWVAGEWRDYSRADAEADR